MYRIERQDQLYKTLPHALFFSPTIVIFSALTLLLPLSGVFAPGSLAITTKNVLDHVGPCMIPSGNLSAIDTPDSTSLFAVDHQGQWFSVSPRASTLTLQWLIDQHIPDLPHACGPNCRYKVHVPSFSIQCTPNPSSLPYSQGDDPIGLPDGKTLWNGTLYKDETHIGFYVAWDSNNITGTSGNASCILVQAEYDVEVRIITFSTSLSLIFQNVDTRFRRKTVSN